MLLIFTLFTTLQLEIGKTSFLSAISHLSQLQLFLVLIAEREGIGKIGKFIQLIREAECMLYGKENLNSRFCPLTLLTGAEVQLSIQNTLSLMLVYCVLLKGKRGHPFFQYHLIFISSDSIRFKALYSDLHMA